MTRRNWAFDVALALLVGVLGQLEAWTGFGATHRQGPLWAQAALYAATALLLVGRRWRPVGVLSAMVVISAVEFAAVGSPEGYGVSLAPVIATYTVASRLPWRRSWMALALSAVLQGAWAGLDPMSPTLWEKLGALVWFAPALIAWLLGSLVRTTRVNAEQRRLNEVHRASAAVAEERNRIARELHDVVGHSVSVMTVQASAVRRRLDPSQTVERAALEAVEATGREALSEMRRMVGMLRGPEDETALEPASGLDDLDRLVEQVRAAGLPVSVTVTGTPRELPPGLDLTAYRIVQEGLTNALRHAAAPRSATVEVDYGTSRLELTVRDDGEPVPGAEPGAVQGPGTGLLGMRERVTVYGGDLVARRHPDGGFELSAGLPLGQA